MGVPAGYQYYHGGGGGAAAACPPDGHYHPTALHPPGAYGQHRFEGGAYDTTASVGGAPTQTPFVSGGNDGGYFGADSSSSTSSSAAAAPPPPPLAAHSVEHFVMLFEYRTFFESADIDSASLQGWIETLSSFGYEDLDMATFFKELCHQTPAEVMMALCPFTTMTEWTPALNKRDVRLTREFVDFCSTNVLIINGLKQFLMSCHANAKVTVVLMTPFSEAHTRLLLEKANSQSLVDCIAPYKQLEFAALDALELLDIPPPQMPPHVDKHRWSNRAAYDPQPYPTKYFAFVSSTQHAKFVGQFGFSVFGVTYNNEDHDNSPSHMQGRRGPSRPVLEGCDAASELLSASPMCRLCLDDYRSLNYPLFHAATEATTRAYM